MCLVRYFYWSYLLIVNVISSATAGKKKSDSLTAPVVLFDLFCPDFQSEADASSSIATAAHRLSVMLVGVESDSVLLEWNCFPPSVRQQLVTCQARYGLLTPEKTVLQVYRGLAHAEVPIRALSNVPPLATFSSFDLIC